MAVNNEEGGPFKRAKLTARRYGVCGETGHNARTCEKDEEGSS